LRANFTEIGGLSPTTVSVRKLRVPALSRGVVCVILRLAVLIQYCTVFELLAKSLIVKVTI